MINQGSILYKHVLAIHSGASLSLLDRKVCNALLITSISKTDKDEQDTIQVSSLLNLIGTKTRNYHQIYLTIKRLASTVIEWGILKKDSFKGNLTGVSFLQMYHIENGLITYRIAKELKEIMVSPNQYASIRMATVASMESSFGLALYENCASYIGIGETGWISIEEFRKLMGIEDVYPLYKDVKRRVINSAINDVNKNSEFRVELFEKKYNKKTSKIKFTIKNKEDAHENPAVSKLEEFGLSRKKINQLSENYSPDYIEKKIKYISDYPGVRNKAGLLIKAVEEGYQSKPNYVKPNLKDRELLESEYQNYKNNFIKNWLEKLSDTEWASLIKIVISDAKHSNIILYREFLDRLPDRSYLNFENTTKRDLYQYLEICLLQQPESLSFLNPPPMINWKKWVEICQVP